MEHERAVVAGSEGRGQNWPVRLEQKCLSCAKDLVVKCGIGEQLVRGPYPELSRWEACM